MATYDWRDYQARGWTQRFPESVRGAAAWRELTTVERAPSILFEERLREGVRLARPCLFVSHRQADVKPALRIAYLACQEGFHYWLDVLDPNLNALPGTAYGGPTPRQSAAAIAGIVEMALLNSTHVVAVITENTKGSFWVPYEYGRVKEPAPITLQAGCWIDGALPPSSLPEYLYLGVVTRTESDLQAWLRREAQNYGTYAGSCVWTKSIPPSL